MSTLSGLDGPTDEESIRRLEWNLGYQLPSQYRNFLLQHDGGQPTPDAFDFEDGSTGSVISHFAKVNSLDRSETILDLVLVLRDRIPVGFLPFGEDAVGNVICLGILPENEGHTYLWDHENEADIDETPTMTNMRLIARSFDDFIFGIFDDS